MVYHLKKEKIFDEAAKEATKVERSQWDNQIKHAIEQAKSMGVKFVNTDVEAFKEKVLPLHKELLSKNKKLQPIYDEIQQINNKLKEVK